MKGFCGEITSLEVLFSNIKPLFQLYTPTLAKNYLENRNNICTTLHACQEIYMKGNQVCQRNAFLQVPYHQSQIPGLHRPSKQVQC